MFVNFNILNQLGSPAINSNTFANRPAAGQTGRLFVSTDTFEIYRDNGTTWDLIGGPGSSTITGTGTATQVAYFTSSQAIGSSANLYWDNTNTRLGIGTSTPGVRLDIHGTGNMLQINSTSATANALMSFQRTGTNVWRLGDQYNGGSNFFELHNTALANNAIQIDTATNKSTLTSIQSYSTGLARGNYLDYTLSLTNGTTFTSPNTVTALGATLNLNIAGSATIPAGARSGADFFNGINFTSAGTFTVNQSSTIRAFSNVTAGWAFNGSAVGTVTHLAGLRVLFPTNSGSAINVTDNYALLINNQNANTGTITYTNRWGIYQEGASDLNYMAANLLLGSTVNTGDKLQVTGTTYLSSQLTVGNTLYVDTVFNRVGIGTTSPNDKLEVVGSGGTFGADNNGHVISKQALDVATAGGRFTGQSNRGSLGSIHIEQTNTGADGGYIEFRTSSSGSTTPSAKMRLDESGNLGLGVTPDAWSVINAFQVGNGASLSGFSVDEALLAANTYYNSGFKYAANGYATSYSQQAGVHYWNIASSGTAGNAIIFTQAMTLDALGRLGIGTTNPAAKLDARVPVESPATGAVALIAGTSNGANDIFRWFDGTSQLGVIKNNGNFLIGTTTDAGQKLQVNGAAKFSNNVEATNFFANSGGSLFLQDPTAAITIRQNSTSNNLTINFNRSGVDLWSIQTVPNGANEDFRIYNYQNSTSSLIINSAGAATFSSSVTTGAPSGGTAAAWKLGSRVAAAVALDATQYIELDVGGTLYKLAIVT